MTQDVFFVTSCGHRHEDNNNKEHCVILSIYRLILYFVVFGDNIHRTVVLCLPDGDVGCFEKRYK